MVVAPVEQKKIENGQIKCGWIHDFYLFHASIQDEDEFVVFPYLEDK